MKTKFFSSMRKLVVDLYQLPCLSHIHRLKSVFCFFPWMWNKELRILAKQSGHRILSDFYTSTSKLSSITLFTSIFFLIYIDILLASLFFPSSDIKGNTKHYTEYKYKKLCKDLGNTMCLQYKVNCSVIKSRLTLWDPMDYSVPGLPVPQCLGVFSSSCPLSRWCYPTFSSAATLFFYLQSFPAPGSFPMSQLFASGG